MEILKLLTSLALALLNPIILVPAIVIIVFLVKTNKEYKESSYYQITKLPYLSVRYNAGRYGEYLIYKNLKHMESDGSKFLFNLYIPKGNGEAAEIDVLMICPKGIFVFESKNFSGWIFGNENHKNWHQTLPAGRGKSHKEAFYNPIMQNRSHIKHLKVLLGEQLPFHSIIIFSDRCTLKDIQITSNDVGVINRHHISPVVSSICNQIPFVLLSEQAISGIYQKLYSFTQVDEAIKAHHVTNIYNKTNTIPVTQPQTNCTPHFQPSTDTAQNPIQTQQIEQPSNPPQIKCPWCNGNLVIRTATRGANAGNQFYGCSNFPRCRYIQNIARK